MWNSCPTKFMWILIINSFKIKVICLKMANLSLIKFCFSTCQVHGYKMFYCTAAACTCDFYMTTSEMASWQN